MRELTAYEIEEVNGGGWFAIFFGAVIMACAGAWVNSWFTPVPCVNNSTTTTTPNLGGGTTTTVTYPGC